MKSRALPSGTAENAGSILILALWVLFFLAALSVAVGSRVGGMLNLAARIRTETAAYCLARAGVERVIMDVSADTNAWDGLDEPWFNDEESYHEVELGGGHYSVSYQLDTATGGKKTFYGVVGEESKININRAGRELLEAFFQYTGRLDKIAAAELASSVLDWRDADDDPLTGGAETGYYRALSRPYRCHNGDFDSLHELMLVKGMQPELFRKLEPHMTVYGTGKVNVNTADVDVLMSVALSSSGQGASASDSLIKKILAFRESGGAFHEASPAMLRQLGSTAEVGNEEGAALANMLGSITVRSTVFKGEAAGKASGRSAEDSRIAFVFDRERMKILYWHEQ